MKVVGHRGACALAPENTFASFDEAIKIGADSIETDVQKTKDGRLVLFHDKTLDRTTNGSGTIQEKTWDELQKLDAGSWFDKKFANEKIPLLSGTLQKYGGIISFEIEIKQAGIEMDVLKMVEAFNLLEKTIFTSFYFDTICNLKKNYPSVKTGYLTSDISDGNIKNILDAGIDQLCPKADLLTKDLVEKWKSIGFTVRAWGVKNTEIMRQAIEAEVDGMTVDFPDLLLKELGRYNLKRKH